MDFVTSHKLDSVNYIKFTSHSWFAVGNYIPSFKSFWTVFQKTLMLNTCRSQEPVSVLKKHVYFQTIQGHKK